MTTFITSYSQLNNGDRISYESNCGTLTATVSHIRIGKNGLGKMVPFLSLNVDAMNGRKAHRLELLGGNSLPMYRIRKL
jgi:hypothetical protein